MGGGPCNVDNEKGSVDDVRAILCRVTTKNTDKRRYVQCKDKSEDKRFGRLTQ